MLVLVLEKGHSSLQDVLDAGVLPRAEQLSTLTRVGECIASLHAKRIVHCDVKPSNIVLFRDGPREVYKLIDMETCTEVGQAQSSEHTPQYCPPEMAKALKRTPPTPVIAHPTYDVFSFGLLCVHVLTGKPFWDGYSPEAILEELIGADYTLNAHLPKSITSQARSMLKKCLVMLPSTPRPRMRDLLDQSYFRLSMGKTTMVGAVKVSEGAFVFKCV